MTDLYPLRFEPIFRQYLWGGRRLETLLGKAIGAEGIYAESWEVVDHGNSDVSVVANGPLAGRNLHQIINQSPAAFYGRHSPRASFPLLFKLLDAHRRLSVQVHPNDEQASRLDPPDLGKTEAWFILAADEGSKIYAGLKRGFDRHALQREVNRGTCELCLHTFEPQVGDCIFIPAGTVHAIGAGLVVAEIQQASDTTFRLFDWNRVDATTGKSRELHIAQSLEAIDYDRGPVNPQPVLPTAEPHIGRLVDCDKFVLERWEFDTCQPIGGDDQFRLVYVVGGEVGLDAAYQDQPLQKGETVLVPACSGPIVLRPNNSATLLVASLPLAAR